MPGLELMESIHLVGTAFIMEVVWTINLRQLLFGFYAATPSIVSRFQFDVVYLRCNLVTRR